MAGHRTFHVGCDSPAECEVDRRALTLWPGLDQRALSRCGHDIGRVATLVERRTSLPATSIRELLSYPAASREEAEFWFG
jgi:hypothetical protein